MRKNTLRHLSALTGLLAPLFLQACSDNSSMCETRTTADGQTVCKTVNIAESTLALSGDEPPGDHCANGGQRIDTGFDDNGNGQLDSSEVIQSVYVCNGAPAANFLIEMIAEDPSATCPNGSIRLYAGLDTNGDGLLEDPEYLDIRDICQGATGATGADGATGATGATGAGVDSFGYGFDLATIPDATVVGGDDVPFSNNGPLAGVTHTAGTTTFTIPNSGTYLITYAMTFTSGVGAELAIAVNGSVDVSSAVTLVNSTDTVSGTVQLTLSAGDAITLRNNSVTALTMALSPAAGAQLDIVQIN